MRKEEKIQVEQTIHVLYCDVCGVKMEKHYETYDDGHIHLSYNRRNPITGLLPMPKKSWSFDACPDCIDKIIAEFFPEAVKDGK